MSELKAVHAFDVYEAYTKTGDDDEAQVYLKSEADKVIAELKKEIEEQKRLRDMALASVPNVLKVMKIIRHHQFKRCLAMAKWCFTKSNYHFVLARHGEDAKKKITEGLFFIQSGASVGSPLPRNSNQTQPPSRTKENKMSEKVINILKHEDGKETVIVEFGLGKIGIGLLPESESQLYMAVGLQELNEAKDVGAFLTAEERDYNFKNAANPLEVALAFPDVKAIDNFIETLKIYRQKVFFPNARTRHG